MKSRYTTFLMPFPKGIVILKILSFVIWVVRQGVILYSTLNITSFDNHNTNLSFGYLYFIEKH